MSEVLTRACAAACFGVRNVRSATANSSALVPLLGLSRFRRRLLPDEDEQVPAAHVAREAGAGYDEEFPLLGTAAERTDPGLHIRHVEHGSPNRLEGRAIEHIVSAGAAAGGADPSESFSTGVMNGEGGEGVRDAPRQTPVVSPLVSRAGRRFRGRWSGR